MPKISYRALAIVLFTIHLSSIFGQVDSIVVGHDEVLDEVIVKPKVEVIVPLKGGELQIKPNSLHKVPQLMGAADPVRTAQLLPGIATTGDISSGLYIRGLEPSHNLFLLNEAPVYNATHLMGILPTINADHIAGMDINKNRIESEYGGRLGSVVAVKSKDYVPSKAMVRTNVGLIMSDATVHVPLNKKSSLLLSGRACYVNQILKLGKMLIDNRATMKYNIYDLNATYNYHVSDKSKFMVSAFFSHDNLMMDHHMYALEANYEWTNFAVSAIWEREWDDKWDIRTTTYNTIYDDGLGLSQSDLNITTTNRIIDTGAKTRVRHQINAKIQMQYGVEFAYRNIEPQYVDLINFDFAVEKPREKNIENYDLAAYAQMDYQILPKLKASVGIRYGGVLPHDLNIEPRSHVSYDFTENINASVAYSRQHQYVAQVLLAGTGFPISYFVGTGDNSPPQRSDNVSLSTSYTSNDKRWGVSLAGYYRDLNNVYENGVSLTSTVLEGCNIHERYALGMGRSMGMEAMFNYHFGKFSGWASYTLGRSERENKALSNVVYRANNDRLHDLSLVINYAHSRKWEFAGTFVYATGVPTTPSMGVYANGGVLSSQYGPYNSGKMPDYHRLDLSATRCFYFDWCHYAALNISVINVYNRQNPFFSNVITRTLKESTGIILFEKGMSLFPILPSVSFTLRF